MIGHYAGNAVFVLSAAFDVALACLAVVWIVRGKRPWLRVVPAAALVLGVLSAKGVAMVAQGLNRPFGVIHVVWLDLVVVLPLAGLLTLGLLRGRHGARALRVAAIATACSRR